MGRRCFGIKSQKNLGFEVLAKGGKVCYAIDRSARLEGGLTKIILLAFKPGELPLWGA